MKIHGTDAKREYVKGVDEVIFKINTLDKRICQMGHIEIIQSYKHLILLAHDGS